ncbi:hypothetical protein H1R17_03775 [Flavobacterium sp. xlx-214]|uniref:hypothetical protein n=1 Tax=unclassified Flavobacterium TaxID=196869 RepID=UPI0013D71932|nr:MULTISPECIES: hypothetical protein [unclassified Flavobacterium]MBA5792010.1 hypothetical protein [Flavobacterium sp. xlx-221]QMI84264.1 hypothetical protein H1R17_03775 [Flavobacterium sp. xlx-214]
MIGFLILLIFAFILDYFMYTRLKPLTVFVKKTEVLLSALALSLLVLGLVLETFELNDVFMILFLCIGMVITRFFDAMNLNKERNQIILFRYLLEIMLVFCIITQFAYIWDKCLTYN